MRFVTLHQVSLALLGAAVLLAFTTTAPADDDRYSNDTQVSPGPTTLRPMQVGNMGFSRGAVTPSPSVNEEASTDDSPAAGPAIDAPEQVDPFAPVGQPPMEPQPSAEIQMKSASDSAISGVASVEDRATTDAGNETPLEPIPNPQESGPVTVEAASFKGTTPGITTVAELEKTWGAAQEIQKRGELLLHTYAMEPFDQIEVTCANDKVISIVVRFQTTFPVGAVAEQLELANIRPVLVSDEVGQVLGQVYPERGVLFAFAPSDDPEKPREVAQLILEPIAAEPFVLRAETTLNHNSELSLRDLEQALKLQPENARAHWLQGRILSSQGKNTEAAKAVAEAVRLESSNARYLVTQAQILARLGQIATAAEAAQKAVELAEKRPHIQARAFCILGDLAASGVKPNYQQALALHMQAVKTADPLAADRHPAIRIPAKEVLVDAHLGAAHDIAWGDFKQKEKAVTAWLSRAGAFALEMIEKDGAGEEIRFRVCARALAACVALKGRLNPKLWTEGAIDASRQLIEESDDVVRNAEYQWDLGLALYDVVQICQMRNEHDDAMKYGQQAIECLSQANEKKQSPMASLLIGRLYFRTGAIYAIRDGDHKKAVTWFDKAVPLLKQPVPEEAFDDLGHHGETFVSMGVSYWEVGQRDTAVETTQIGIALMKEAVRQGSLSPKALEVPYSNLASMHRQLGQVDDATRYEEMAKRNGETQLQ